MTGFIHILNASRLPAEDISAIAADVEEIFHVRTIVERSQLEIERAYDNSRGQYSSSLLLEQIHGSTNGHDEKSIAIVDVDLFIPVLTFIFGEAQLNGSVAIVSTHRLSNTFYGLPDDHEKLLARLGKEVVHELGHTFGLYHCHQFECVMRSSTYAEEIDLKRQSPCVECAFELSQLNARVNNTN